MAFIADEWCAESICAWEQDDMNDTGRQFDYDWLIVGSGFGGSVSALRLAEKGYKVGVLEAGRRYRDEDYAKTTWDLKRFLWAPAIGLRGIFRLTPFKDVFIASGAAVGGGSVVYANTLYRASPEFFVNPQWAGINDWSAALAPHYDTAEKMLGVQMVPHAERRPGPAARGRQAFRRGGHVSAAPRSESSSASPARPCRTRTSAAKGPRARGCTRCGACMVGCREGAKNTLVKNYLWFAEKRGVEIHPEREVVDIRPIGAEDGADGYTVTTERPGAWFRKQRRTFTARGIVISAGALGTNQLLARCKLGGSLPGISDRLGHLVRTNSESILAVTLPEGMARPWNDVAISASIYPRADTHIEFVTYGKHGDFMSLLYTLITGKGTRVTRPLKWLGNIARHPLTFLKTLWPVGWSERSVLFLVMQSLDNAISFRAKRGLFGGVSLKTEQDPEKPNPTFIEVANQAAEWLAERTGGYAQSMVLEAWANVPTTAHILGGAVIGRDASSGVVDAAEPAVRVPEFPGLRRIDGAGQSGREPVAHDHGHDRARDEPDTRQGLVSRVMRAAPGA